ncbi:MAG: RCC1 domain-containing protein [Pseudomarimonas sp.]
MPEREATETFGGHMVAIKGSTVSPRAAATPVARNLGASEFTLWSAACILALLFGSAGQPVAAQGLEPLTDAVQVAAGGDHTCALTTGGGVKCWGDNLLGQLGDGSRTTRVSPVDVSGLGSGVAAISADAGHTCALSTGGGLKCWGDNSFGQLGDGSNTQRLTPADVAGLGSGVAAISVGAEHTCALTTGGGVKCWGANFAGQLGDGSRTRRPTPVDVSGLSSGVAAISAGFWHTCALTTGGGVKCWGNNIHGQLGDGSSTERLTAVDVSGLGNGVAAISAGALHTCALSTGGGVKCWGYNNVGQLGDGSNTNRLAPADVSGLGSGVAEISTGEGHTCALTTGGGVKCWGDNLDGQLGDGNSSSRRSTPVDVSDLSSGVAAISAGDSHTCAQTTSGGVKCWGGKCDGQLGDGSRTQRLTAVAVSGLASGVDAISAGGSHTCALTTGGGVKCWGENVYGQLGDGSSTTRVTPVDVAGLGSDVAAISAGFRHTCALTRAGGLKCWGGNFNGELGDGSRTDRLTPVDVAGLGSGVAAISTGTAHTCALTTAGGMKCWGGNSSGVLGDGSSTTRVTPVDVAGLSSGVAAISVGGSHTCALTAGGGVKCWGNNFYGQLGDGTTTTRLTAVDVAGLGSGVAAISAGSFHTCALITGGGVKCWGENASGRVGDGSNTHRLTPVDVSGLGSGVAAIRAGGAHTCALTLGGGVKCWGENFKGQLGDGSRMNRLTPVDVSGLGSGIAAISVGFEHTCALTTGDSATCWGSDESGQIGDGGRNYGISAAVLIDKSQSQIASASTGGNAGSGAAVSDAMGRFTVFESSASNLVLGDGNNAIDIFRRDASTGAVLRVSVADDDSEISGPSIEPSVSAEGQWVVFVAADSAVGKLSGESASARKQRSKGGTHGIFLRNLLTGSTRRVGTALAGGTGTQPVIAPQGGSIAFTGLPTVPGQGTPGISTIFVVPLQRMGNELLPGIPLCVLCAPPSKALSQSPSRSPVLSADGRWLAFVSEATNVAGLVKGCPQASSQIVLRNLVTGSTVSASSPSNPNQCSSGGAQNPSIDWAGGAVVFESTLPLDTDDRNGFSDIYRFDATTGEHERVSTDPSTGHDGLDASSKPRISGDGKVVTFQSLAKNIESSEPDNNETNDILVRNVETATMRRVSRNRRGDQGNDTSDGAALSWDGAAVVFASSANNLILNPLTGSSSDSNNASDVFQTANPLVPIRKTGTWWIPAESGWGVSTIDQGNALGVSWFTYDSDGEPTWFSGSALLQPDGRYVGNVFRQTGVPLADITGLATESSTRFADVTLSFTGSGALTFDYAVIGGVTQRKQMSRFIFGGDDIVCRISPFPTRAGIGNLSDVWWGGAATSGWGILLSETSSILAVTWYTFDQDREAIFLIAVTTRQADGSYAGSIVRQRNGTAFSNINNAPPSSGADVVGSARLTIIDGETADFVYTIGSVTQTKRISRFVFGTAPNVCATARP